MLKEDEVVYATSVTHQDMRRVGVIAKPTFLWAERERGKKQEQGKLPRNVN